MATTVHMQGPCPLIVAHVELDTIQCSTGHQAAARWVG